MKALALVLSIWIILMPALAFAAMMESGSLATREAQQAHFWQEFDITFWQTVPFAAFWAYVICLQLAGGGVVNWDTVGKATLVISAVNATLHARKVAR
jgi:hypothetical protein